MAAYERTQWLVGMKLSDFQRILPIRDSPCTTLIARLMPGLLGNEPSTSALQQLLSMDVNNEYMVSFELFYDAPATRTSFTYPALVTRTFAPSAVRSPFNVSFTLEVPAIDARLFAIGKGACLACGKFELGTKLSKCSKCCYARYCSAACQQENWPRHRPQCALLKELAPRKPRQ